MANNRELTNKQKLFVKYYVQTFNASEAYKNAGYKATTSIRQNAHALLTNPYIHKAISEEKTKLTARVNIEQDDVLAILVREANYFGEGATHSARVQAATQLGRYFSMFTDNQNINSTDIEARMKAAEERIREHDKATQVKDSPAQTPALEIHQKKAI